ncbi:MULTISPECIES: flagellin N-terminal helical domain-containing protein [Curtobacterium]|jgi:flagellin|uniref:flagellin N-terminal helical domain-containing protein n=1 Tax=Curtobacterium TaxID=2034 RepID=UPI0015E8A39D|nr:MULTISPECIES: flagellin [Curtobacterium]MDO3696902.1 flagellin [Curtobacterium flaccumfaciens]MBF4615036.1 flagellin [Curtobacterium sp. VKM Ac-1376]MBT1582821.1 flagellin [Curtobacterium flaccumfaciens pv. flaccumfaciens]MBT1668071.1 flagellin [Curtobacterium flaccumfaciens pv. flaccumfaciens]MCS5493756.1 flagellin [Curtobacterium flaccumfaciens pv. flaccumfaciens]
MGMSINTNLSALNTYRNLNATQNDLSKSLEKLSSGLRINRAADDAAGLSISEGLKSQVGGLTVAARNAQDGISVVQTAEGGLTETHSILQRMRDLAVQAGNDSNNEDSRKAITTEVGELTKELTRISESTNFNGINLLDGSAGTAGVLKFQVGANGDAASQIDVDLSKSNVESVSTAVGALTFDSATNAQAAITAIDEQIKYVSSARSSIGAVQNRFDHAINVTNVAKENLTAASSRITDVDMAEEMVKYTRDNILSQAGTSMLAQANQSTQGVLSLLR